MVSLLTARLLTFSEPPPNSRSNGRAGSVVPSLSTVLARRSPKR